MSEVLQQPSPEELYQLGWYDLVSVIPPGAQMTPTSKIPQASVGKCPGRRLPNGLWAGFNWREHKASAEDVRRWSLDGANVGLRTDRFPSVDIDATDPRIAQIIEDAAREKLGEAPIRVGRAPKRLLMYRTDEPFGRMRLWIERNGVSHLVEILGAGQQVVVYGTHPATLQPYAWETDPRDFGADGLTTITREQASEFLDFLADRVTQLNAGTVEREGDGKPPAERAADQQGLRAPSIELVREAVRLIPNNNDLFPARNDYLKMGAAIRASCGEEDEGEGWAIFAEWADRWEGNSRFDGNDPEVVHGDWRRIKPPFSVGWNWLAEMARPFGFNDAALDFEALEQEAAEPLPTDGERIAALHGDPMRAFFGEMAGLADGELLVRYAQLQRAAATRDPLARAFRELVPIALRHRSLADEQRRFEFMLEADMTAPRGEGEGERASRWAALGEANQRLLLRAAYAFAAPLTTFAAAHSDSPGPRVPLVAADTDDLVTDVMPARGVAGVVGPPGAGKSWVVGGLAASVAKCPEVDAQTGVAVAERFGGFEVKHGSVFYFASEHAHGVARRAADWEREYGRAEHLNLYSRVPLLTDPQRTLVFMLNAIKELPSDAPPLRLIVIDVLRGAIVGEENSSEVMGAAMLTATLLARMTGALVMLVHHSSKARPDDPRGHSAMRGALDWLGSVEKTDDTIEITVQKDKDRPEGTKLRFHIRDNVLRDGPAKPDDVLIAGAVEEFNGEAAAAAAGRAVRILGAGGLSVTRTELNNHLAGEHPHYFDVRDDAGRLMSTAKSRRNRARSDAIDKGYIVVAKGERFRPGPKEPPLEKLTAPIDISSILIPAEP